MSLAFSPIPLLTETPEQKYEESLNELLQFGDFWWHAYDQKALRIVLASVWMHLYRKDAPWLWVLIPPQKLDQALGGRFLFSPGAATIEKEMQCCRGQSLWVLTGQEGMFHRTPGEIEKCLHLFNEIEDDMQVTAICCTSRPLDRLQAARCRPLWPIVQNTFVTVRFADMGVSVHEKDELRRQWRDKDEYVVKTLRAMVSNLMDSDFRDRRHIAKEPVGLFAGLSYLQVIVSSLRGPGFDSGLLALRAVHLALAHATMMGKAEADAEDYSLARKIMLDALPPSSVRVLAVLPMDGWWTLSSVETKNRGIPRNAILHTVEQLHQAEAVLRIEGGRPEKDGRLMAKSTADHYSVTPELQQALLAGF